MRFYGCCSAGAGRRAEPSLLVGVWLLAVLLESHTVFVHDRPGRCFPGTVHRIYPFGEGMSRRAVSFASLRPARERSVRMCTARVRTRHKRGFSYKHHVRFCERSETSAARSLLLTTAVYPNTCYYCVVLTTVYQFQSIFVHVLISYYSSIIKQSSSTLTIIARPTSSTLESQNENATARHIHVQPPCDWHLYIPFNY